MYGHANNINQICHSFANLITEIIWFVFGAALTAVAVTGTMIYSLRLAKTSRQNGSAIALACRGMGVWGNIGIALVLLALAMTPVAIGGAS